MSYIAVIRRESDGVERECHIDVQWHVDDEGSDELFWWEDGNMSCDCARAAEFARAAGEPEPNQSCTSSAYRVVRFVLEDGRIVVPSESQP